MAESKIEQLERQLAEERKARQEEKAARGHLEAKMETLLQLVAAKSEPERIQMLEKQEFAKKRAEIKKEAMGVALAQLGKGAKKEQVKHLRYVTGSYYHRKGTLYPPGTVLKIPANEEPSLDWKPWKPPRISRPVAIDPDAAGTPYGEVRQNTSAIAAIRRDEAAQMREAIDRGDVVVSTTVPDQGEQLPPASVEELEQHEQPTEQGPEGTALPRASDTDVG